MVAGPSGSATAGRVAMSPGTRRPGPFRGENDLVGAIGSGTEPIVRSGSGAGAQGGAPGPEALARLVAEAAFGTGVMAGPNDRGEEVAISPKLPPCQPPGAGHPPAAGAAGAAGTTGGTIWGRTAGPGLTAAPGPAAGLEPSVKLEPPVKLGLTARPGPAAWLGLTASGAACRAGPGTPSGLRCVCDPRDLARAGSAAARLRREVMTSSSTTSSKMSTPRTATTSRTSDPASVLAPARSAAAGRARPAGLMTAVRSTVRAASTAPRPVPGAAAGVPGAAALGRAWGTCKSASRHSWARTALGAATPVAPRAGVVPGTAVTAITAASPEANGTRVLRSDRCDT